MIVCVCVERERGGGCFSFCLGFKGWRGRGGTGVAALEEGTFLSEISILSSLPAFGGEAGSIKWKKCLPHLS